jgi:hypothetical protein
MSKIIFTILLTLLLFSVKSEAQKTEHIKGIFFSYHDGLTKLEGEIDNFNNDSLLKKEHFIEIILRIKDLQSQKFNLDSAFIEYEYMSKRILLSQILTKEKLKKRNRNQLKEDLLKWNYNSCHPTSDRLWHSVSKFLYKLETFSNSKLNQENTLLNLLNEIKQQQKIASVILKDI